MRIQVPVDNSIGFPNTYPPDSDFNVCQIKCYFLPATSVGNEQGQQMRIQIPVDNSMGFPYTYLLDSDFNVRQIKCYLMFEQLQPEVQVFTLKYMYTWLG